MGYLISGGVSLAATYVIGIYTQRLGGTPGQIALRMLLNVLLLAGYVIGVFHISWGLALLIGLIR